MISCLVQVWSNSGTHTQVWLPVAPNVNLINQGYNEPISSITPAISGPYTPIDPKCGRPNCAAVGGYYMAESRPLRGQGHDKLAARAPRVVEHQRYGIPARDRAESWVLAQDAWKSGTALPSTSACALLEVSPTEK